MEELENIKQPNFFKLHTLTEHTVLFKYTMYALLCRRPFSQNFQLQISETFWGQIERLSSSRSKIAISLVDQKMYMVALGGTKSQQNGNGNFVQMEAG